MIKLLQPSGSWKLFIRQIMALVLLVFSLLSLTACGPEDLSYYPLKEGHWWEYKETLVIRDESHTRRRIVSNLQPVTIKGEKLFVKESQGQERQFFSLEEGEVFRKNIDDDKP